MKKYGITVVGLAALLTGMASARAADMNVERIILSTSGLAQFEHRAKVDGNAALSFPVRFDQVDDVLKSLVVFDARGRVGAVTLPGLQPLDQVFSDLPFDRGQLSSTMMLLNAYQGATVTAKSSSSAVTGRIVQVEAQESTDGVGRAVVRHRLGLMTPDGLRQVVLEDLQSLQFADDKIRAQISRALDAIRDNSTAGARTLTLDLKGEGSRDVALSYVVSAPLWKAAYRMVVPAEGKEKGFLQGWAVLENMTPTDWTNVDLSLVSGNPVAFRQALYPSYYVDRPEVPVQVFGMVLPKVDDGAVPAALQSARAAKAAPVMMRAQGFAPAPVMAESSVMADSISVNMAGGAMPVLSQDTATQVLFNFPSKLSLKAGQSMMLPFVSRDLPMERVFVYQPDTNARHPLAAVEVTNDSGVGLPPGVLTFYEDNSLLKTAGFAGDAQMPVMAKGEKRLLPYALDNKTTIDRADHYNTIESRVTADAGVLKVAVSEKVETEYTLKAPADESRSLVIEHPRLPDYKLVTPAPDGVEMTDGSYRIRVALKAGEVLKFPVVQERQIWRSYGIDGLDAATLAAYATTRGDLSADVRKQFDELAAVRREIEAVDVRLREVAASRDAIFADQERVRENLKSLTGKSDVQKRYLDRLNTQEDQIAKLDKERDSLSEKRASLQASLRKKIAALKF